MMNFCSEQFWLEQFVYMLGGIINQIHSHGLMFVNEIEHRHGFTKGRKRKISGTMTCNNDGGDIFGTLVTSDGIWSIIFYVTAKKRN